MQALDQGACGYVSKDRSLSEVLEAIRRAVKGEMAISVNLLVEMLSRRAPASTLAPGREEAGEHRKLTRREREILTCLAQGQSGAEIAAQLNLSGQTIRTFIRNILEKLEVHSRMEAVFYALRHGLIDSLD